MLLFVSLARKSGREAKIRNKINQMKAVSFILVFVGAIEQKCLRRDTFFSLDLLLFKEKSHDELVMVIPVSVRGLNT